MWPESLALRYRLEIPEATPSNNVIKNMHFHRYAALRRSWQAQVFGALGGKRATVPLSISFLKIFRESAGSGLDWDNAYGGLKPLLDCLVMPSVRNPQGLGLIQDDSPSHMPYPPFMQQGHAPLKKGRTVIEIFEVLGPPINAIQP